MDRGYIHVYTGNGKGKTTAALGLSLRAVCAGKKVFFGQFVKGMKYSEMESEKLLPNFTIEQFGRNCFIFNEPTNEDRELARNGLKKMAEIMRDGKHDVVVMDELNIALYYRLFEIEDVFKAIDERKESVEVIITGRYAPESIIEKADLVTEMKEIKHYYTQGVEARTGIEK